MTLYKFPVNTIHLIVNIMTQKNALLPDQGVQKSALSPYNGVHKSALSPYNGVQKSALSPYNGVHKNALLPDNGVSLPGNLMKTPETFFRSLSLSRRVKPSSRCVSLLFVFFFFLMAIPADGQEPGSRFAYLSDVLFAGSPEADGSLSIPDRVWSRTTDSGALEFTFRPSREIRIYRESQLTMTLISTPILLVEVIEDERHSWIQVSVPVRDRLGNPVSERFMISHLKPKWYQMILSWHASEGRIEFYLNGTLQVSGRSLVPWNPMQKPSGTVAAGGWFMQGSDPVRLEVRDINIHHGFVEEEKANQIATAAGLTLLDGEGRTLYEESLNLSGLELDLVYEADFRKPLRMIHEDALFDGNRRIREPSGDTDWVLEGNGRAAVYEGRLRLENHDDHIVFWNTRVFPDNFLLEFTMQPENPEQGLAIIFFCAKPVLAESLFSLDMPKRSGSFPAYTRQGFIHSYHTSYMATFPPDETGKSWSRRTTNLRKNDNHHMIASGSERIHREGEGINTIRLFKLHHRIRLEVNGKIVIAYDDHPDLYSLPVWGEGLIGLRQMQHTQAAEYESFRVFHLREHNQP